jgi:hypothetical protein
MTIREWPGQGAGARRRRIGLVSVEGALSRSERAATWLYRVVVMHTRLTPKYNDRIRLGRHVAVIGLDMRPQRSFLWCGG